MGNTYALQYLRMVIIYLSRKAFASMPNMHKQLKNALKLGLGKAGPTS